MEDEEIIYPEDRPEDYGLEDNDLIEEIDEEDDLDEEIAE